jgi:HEAT repeat protein
MKSRNSAKNKIFTIVLLIAMIFPVSFMLAQNNSIKDITDHKYALDNLLAGIRSDNEGVRRSSIYYAGKYKIAEAEQALIEQLRIEPNPGTRTLIAFVLYELGSEEGLGEIKKLAFGDVDPQVRRMSSHLIHEYHVRKDN